MASRFPIGVVTSKIQKPANRVYVRYIHTIPCIGPSAGRGMYRIEYTNATGSEHIFYWFTTSLDFFNVPIMTSSEQEARQPIGEMKPDRFYDPHFEMDLKLVTLNMNSSYPFQGYASHPTLMVPGKPAPDQIRKDIMDTAFAAFDEDTRIAIGNVMIPWLARQKLDKEIIWPETMD